MAVPRIIPVLMHKNGRLVLSRRFEVHQDIGDPYHIIDRYKCWDLDELIYLDITPHWQSGCPEEIFERYVETIKKASRNCFIPLTAGGGICTVDQMHQLIKAGADRVMINTRALLEPGLITAAAHTFGAQAVIVGIDVRTNPAGGYDIYARGGKVKSNLKLVDWLHQAADLGAGEFFINHIDRDGMATGYDMELVKFVKSATDLPLIICGGAGKWDDMIPVLSHGIGAVAAANIFAYTELSYAEAKKGISQACKMRPATIGMDYAQSRRERERGSRLGAEKTVLWRELDKGGLME
ncbi:MAG: imidazole glycerol phosphate synthase subunit HisF [Micavibrio aeruginosavorus]|uniref:imidazole glycerol-phosphate synthase n=1 Tax=Micavibrio aeruginosavorus TaxID=349221 RepID=A0A7T5UHD5_9BACT|nr:MAG: imidazole glycerol phosphate synthase subunit HisF [Micavibrio aeruginosavorus]